MLALAPMSYSGGHLLEWAIAWVYKRLHPRSSLSIA
jgi:hypothetical protein